MTRPGIAGIRRAAHVVLGLILAHAGMAAAEVYKWTDAEGNVHYADEPQQGAEKVELKPLPVMTFPKGEAVPTGRSTGKAEADTQAANYTQLQITRPGSEETLPHNGGVLTVSVAVSPALMDGHVLQVLLDGQPVGTTTSGSLSVSEVHRGEHSVQAVVQDSQGNTLQSSNSVRFYVFQPTQKKKKAP